MNKVRLAAWSKIIGTVFLLVSFIFLVLSVFSGWGTNANLSYLFLRYFFMFFVVTLFFNIFFLYGFLLIGKKFSNKLLYYTSLIEILYSIVAVIGIIIFYSLSLVINSGIIVLGFQILLYSVLLEVIFEILFGIGLIKLGDDVDLAKITGIFVLVGIVIPIVFPVILVLELMILFKTAKLFDNIKI